MSASFSTIRIATARVILCALVASLPCAAQQPTDPSRQDQPEILRVQTQLIQTDVMVFDKQGKFVNDLKREDFQLTIDGKPRTIEFFERVKAGSLNEESQLAAARGAGRAIATGAVPLDRGRPVFFFIDDVHLDPSSMVRTRRLLTRFLDQEMGQNDEAAITSASGQIGFLQQLTDNKTVLRAAIERLSFRSNSIRDNEVPTMSEYQAFRLENYDSDLMVYFVGETMKQNPFMSSETARAIVSTRARVLMAQSNRKTTNTMVGVESLVESAKGIPGRKLVFFISDGFLLDRRNSNVAFTLQRITSAAARSGVVIYSIDAKGLATMFTDPMSGTAFDPTGAVQKSAAGEFTATQDALHTLARETGGKAYLNLNNLDPAIKRGLEDTSNYYLLAWKPDQENNDKRKFRRIEVKVTGRRDLTVQVRRGFFDAEPKVATNVKARTEKARPEKTPAGELAKVIGQAFPHREIPIALNLHYVNLPGKGPMLSASMEVPHEFLSFSPVNGRETAKVDLAGTFFDVKGQRGAEFTERVTITASADGQAKPDLAYRHPVFLSPGIYQVRVAARDEKSGHAGSAHAWIEIPDLSKGQLALSSVLVGSRSTTDVSAAAVNPAQADAVVMSINPSFSNTDYLRFMVFVYNAAATAGAKPDVAVQVQIVRDGQPVVTTSLKKVSIDETTDLARLPFAAEVSLAGLPAGRYLLQVTAVDRVARTSASQQTRFEIQ
jgi:VWFA-related protein